jgi:hypothetical protein
MAAEISSNWPITAVTFPKENTLQAKPGTNAEILPIQLRNRVETIEPDSNTTWEKGMFIDIYA